MAGTDPSVSPTSEKPTGWRKSFAIAGLFNSGASLAIHLTAITANLSGKHLLLASNFLFERLLNWLQTGLSIAVLAGFIGVLRGRQGRWIASWALTVWIIAAAYRLLTMWRFYDPELVKLAAALYIIVPLATLLILLFGFRHQTDRFWRREGVPLGILALALVAVFGISTWNGPFEHGQDIKGLAFSPDGTKIAAADWDGVSLWEFPSGRRLHRIKYPLCEQVAFSPDGSCLAVANDYDHRVNIYSAKTWNPVRTIKLNSPPRLNYLIYSRDGRYVALGGKGVIVLDSQTDQVLMQREMDITFTRGLSLAFSPDALRLAVGLYEGKSVVLLKIGDGSELWKSSFPEEVKSVSFSPNGETLAVALRSGDSGLDVNEKMTRIVRSRPERSAIHFLDVTSGKHKEGAPVVVSSVSDLSFSQDGRFLGWAGDLGWIHVYEVASKENVLSDCFPEKLHRTHFGGSGDVIAFSPDGRYVACGGDMGRVGIWDLTTGREIR